MQSWESRRRCCQCRRTSSGHSDMNRPEEALETDEEPGSEDVNEAVEADLQHSEEEEEAGRRGNSKRGGRARLADEEGTLARSASTESGFHNHTDRAEGDVICTHGDPYGSRERLQDNGEEDERSYAVHCRPEAEEYTENAESEHVEAADSRTLPSVLHFDMVDREGLLGSAYSGYVYSHHPFHRGEDQQYAEPYDDYAAQEHVYEEIGEAPDLDGGETLRLYEREREEAEHYRKEALGARLHHYDERSDNESDSPEKEAEFAPYPRMDSYEQEEDIDQIVAEVKQSMSSQSLDRGCEEMPEAEQNSGSGQEADDVMSALNSRSVSSTGLGESLRHTREQRDAISLAIKDIKEAIEEVKTRTVRSPYTPDEPAEPIWVMRQDISPTAECENQLVMEGDQSASPGSSSPRGAESSMMQHRSDIHDAAETSTNRESRKCLASFPTYVEVPGPCDPEDLIDGIIFAANYLGSTQLLSDKTPSKNVRMMQAQEAVSRIKMAQKLTKNRKKAAEGEAQPMTEVDLFISTQRIKVLNADSQETMMDHPLRTISYIADIGNIVVLMARRRMPRSNSQDSVEASHPSHDGKRQYKMICHVFESEDAQLIAQSIGQAFSVAYQEFLRANGINPEDLSQKEYSDLLNTQDMYNDDLIHFSKSENCKEVHVDKQKGEILGLVIVESGWGSILPTVIIANMMHAGPAEKSGKLNIGDQIMSINGTSLVGLPLSTCQSIIKGLKNQARVKLNIVRCPPVTTVLIRRPDLRYQLGFSVQNGIICSLMRGGIAERGGVRVGHRIIEINGQSVVATPHEKIVHILSNAVGEIHMKTMPAAMYRLLTAQEQPVYI
ncbi:amyloid-beta A4 precursor protein-binding family A member 1-like isoform X4 [Hemiscyllium ocellatum]|uniref:amyloid-beta A4 precursor protein-binding family A member 1-like isoform X4 n=1 Tax=Hemiscyllium ocellatum TaxID=170820 RepID=UPI002965F586|nr:amyloid-beta A4 precursor protein-binding family A member 1-like isoform X4 [Hemiscyllium ocellatum]